jgi:hypothetical protein
LDFRKENGSALAAMLRPDIAAVVIAYIDPKEQWKLLLSSSPNAALRMWNQEFQTHARISWVDWKLYQELRSYPSPGTPIAPANFNAITTIHLEECEGSEAEIDIFFARFETLDGKRLFLPRKHSIAHHFVIAKRVDQIVQLALIDFTCNQFDDLSFEDTFRLFNGKTLHFETVQFSSVHTGLEKLPLASMQQLIRQCSPTTKILVNLIPIPTEDFVALQQEFNSSMRIVNRLQMSG